MPGTGASHLMQSTVADHETQRDRLEVRRIEAHGSILDVVDRQTHARRKEEVGTHVPTPPEAAVDCAERLEGFTVTDQRRAYRLDEKVETDWPRALFTSSDLMNHASHVVLCTHAQRLVRAYAQPSDRRPANMPPKTPMITSITSQPTTHTPSARSVLV